jgi:hypothetical protein
MVQRMGGLALQKLTDRDFPRFDTPVSFQTE